MVLINVIGWLNNDCPTKRSSTVILDVKMAGFAVFLHPAVLFVGPREEHLTMVLFSSFGCYPKYRAVPEASGLPDVSGYPLPDDFQNWIRSGLVSKEIPDSGSGSGARWALNIVKGERWGLKTGVRKLLLPQYMGYNLVLIRGLRFLLRAPWFLVRVTL